MTAVGPGAPIDEPNPPSTKVAKGYGMTLVGLILGGVGALWSLTQPWASEVVSNGFTNEEVAISGASLYPVGLAGAWVALASVVAIVATSGRVRQVFGVVVLASAAAVLAAPLLYLILDEIVVGTDLGEPQSAAGARTSWWIVTLVSGVLIAAAGITTMVRGSRWRRLSARQDGQKSKAEVSDWDALDHGEDPTA
ncbi:MAG: Trp biosynthesis-associated membrane protein [Actinobacteria bacterium]|nr:Trp biosynthesis-associated membrane protein [Actinomycetota bacterium]